MGGEDAWGFLYSQHAGRISKPFVVPEHPSLTLIDRTWQFVAATPGHTGPHLSSFNYDGGDQRLFNFGFDQNICNLELRIEPPPGEQPKRKRKRPQPAQWRVLASFPLQDDESDDLAMAIKFSRAKIPDYFQIQGPFVQIESGPDVEDCTITIKTHLSLIVPDGLDSLIPYPKYEQHHKLFIELAIAKHGGLKEDETKTKPSDLLNTMTKTKRLPAPNLAPLGVRTEMLQYQRESVRWMLRREGRDLAHDESVTHVVSLADIQKIAYPQGWQKIAGLYLNPYSLEISTVMPETTSVHLNGDNQFCGGGLLAEEMGLGKSLEIISLISLNRRCKDHKFTRTSSGLKPVGTTLVIAPHSLIPQWEREFICHAPSLKVGVFDRGSNPHSARTMTVQQIAESDVILVSYNTLSNELHSASISQKPRNIRVPRTEEQQAALRSPLVQLQFWRVVMDEVQMVSSGTSNAAKVARLIPRVHAWGVTGTPIKYSMNDICGIVYFLDLVPYVQDRCWQRLLLYRADLIPLFETIGIRNTKPMISHQLHLPPQKRHLVPINITDFEWYAYTNEWARFNNGLVTGSADKLRFLNTLRQLCCYYFLGKFHGKSQENRKPMDLKEAFANVLQEAEVKVDTDMRAKCTAQIVQGQYLDRCGQYRDAVTLWKSVLEELTTVRHKHVCVKEALEAELEAKKVAADRGESEKADEEKGLTQSDKVTSLRHRIDALNEMIFKTCYFIGTGFYRLRTYGSIEGNEPELLEACEKKYYDLAETERELIMIERAHLFENSLPLLEEVAKQSILRMTPETILEKQADFIQEIMAELLPILTTPLFEGSEEEHIKREDPDAANADGQEDGETSETMMPYAETLENQNKAEYLLELLQHCFNDRSALLNGSNLAIVSTRKRSRIHGKDARFDFYIPNSGYEDTSGWPEGKYEMFMRRAELQNELRLKQKIIDNLAAAEKRGDFVGKVTFKQLRKDLDRLQQLYKTLTNVNNVRIAYYAQLQRLSDSVVDIEIEPSAAQKQLSTRELIVANAGRELRSSIAAHHYIEKLDLSTKAAIAESQAHITQTSGDNTCIICQEEYNKGILTICGHRFCRDCMQQWLGTKNVCPLCKRPLSENDIHYFYIGGNTENSKHEDTADHMSSQDLSHLDSQLYHPISQSLLHDIEELSQTREWGSKIAAISGLITKLLKDEPGTQIVVSSQWPQMLTILGKVLPETGIKTASLAGKGLTEFLNRNVPCFLLNSSSNAAGLTLVNATHVILCDQLLSTAQELQTISRIHRIGQKDTTHVWQFCVLSSVEQAILAVTTEKRVRHIARLRQSAQTSETEKTVEEKAELEIMGQAINRQSGEGILLDEDVEQIISLCSEFARRKCALD